MQKICWAALIALGCAFSSCSRRGGGDEAATIKTSAASSLAQKVSDKTVEGTISGYDCAVAGLLCPSTHRAADYTNGVFTDDGAFYFVVNIPQSFLTQYFLKRLQVTGKVYQPYDYAVEPEKIFLVQDQDKKLVYEAGYFIDANGRKCTFNQGRVIDGLWACNEGQ